MSGSPCPAYEPTSDVDDARPDAVEASAVGGSGSFAMGAPAPGDPTALERFAAAMHTFRTTRLDPVD